jgi:(heptosyl)LPS beta-1,4-glucosyltransferase
MQSLSAVVIARNEARNIERCVRSVLWADEVIVVDSGSVDETMELSRRLGARVIEHAWDGYAVQKEFAVSQASSEWVLSLDADEEVTPELRGEIERLLQDAAPVRADGYNLPRKSHFLGKWIRYGGWYPGYQMRLFRKSAAIMNHRPVHEGFEVRGTTGTLEAPINHYTYDTLQQYLEKMNDYTSLDVMNKLSEQPDTVIRWYHCVLNPIALFLRMFVSLKGYRDGFHGFLLAVYSALYKLLVYAKCWEYQSAQKRGEPPPPVSNADITAMKELRAS